jgi:hypothetical protein
MTPAGQHEMRRPTMNRGIRVLDQPRKEADEHGARLRIGEFLSE